MGRNDQDMPSKPWLIIGDKTRDWWAYFIRDNPPYYLNAPPIMIMEGPTTIIIEAPNSFPLLLI